MLAREVESPLINRGRNAPGWQRRQLTVLFCALVGSTQLARELDISSPRSTRGSPKASTLAI